MVILIILAIDLLRKLLCKNPADRISAEKALQHNWFARYQEISKHKVSDSKNKEKNEIQKNLMKLKEYFMLFRKN